MRKIFALIILSCLFVNAGCGGMDNAVTSAEPTISSSSMTEEVTSPSADADTSPTGEAEISPSAEPTIGSSSMTEEATSPSADADTSPTGEAETSPSAESTIGSSSMTEEVTSPSADADTSPTGEADPSASSGEANVPRPSTSGALSLSGTQLIDENGDAVQLKGISTHGIAWFPEYINQDCFNDLAEFFGANVVRLAMYTAESGGYCTDGDPEFLKKLIKDGVEYASAADMYVIVDWHILADGDPNTNKASAKEFFAWASEEFSGQNNVLYEICNEPNGGTLWAQIKSYAEEIIPIIRENDEDAIIIVGTPNWSQYVNEAAADPIEGRDNIMYTLHFYAATHKDDLRSTMKAAVEAGLPVFVTEYGICDASGSGSIDTEEADKWISLMNELGISYCAWNLSNKDESSAIINSGCGKTSGFEYDDLSESGRWVYEMLNAGEVTSPSANADTSPTGEAVTSPSPSETPPLEGSLSPQALSAPTGVAGDDGSITWSAQLSNSWEADGHEVYMYIFTVKNTGDEALSSWSISVQFDGNITVTDGWNGEFSASGSTLHVSNASYNGSISAGGSVTDIGIILYGGEMK